MNNAIPTPGQFVWHDLMTTELKSSRQFYSDVVGWSYKDTRMGGLDIPLIQVGERDIGGMMPFDPSFGHPSHWVAYVSVSDLEARIKHAESLGAKVCVPPHDTPGIGRFSLLTDPQGALINFFEYSPERPLKPRPATAPPQSFYWNELLTSDPQAARAFYEAVFGWTTKEEDLGPMGTYIICQKDGRDVAGIVGRPMPEDAPHKPMWLGHILVGDSDAAVARAEALGAKRLMGPADIPGIGRFSVICDPQQAMVALFSPAAATAANY